MAKGDVKFITVVGIIGKPATDFNTKEVIPGLYRFQSGDVSWKCAEKQITGKVKLVEDEFSGNVFYRLEGVMSNANQKKLVEDLASVEW